MNLHRNARTTPASRAEMVRRVLDEGQRPAAVARAFGVELKTVKKWVDRFQAEGSGGLEDRSSRPKQLREPTPPQTAERIIALRLERLPGKQIAAETGVSRSTVSRILRAARLSRAKDLDPPAPVVRYERERPGELIHLDIKKLGRFEQVGHRITGDRTRQSNSRGKRGGKPYGAGWEYVHVCIDDASRIAFSQIHPDEKKESALACLEAALAYYASLGVTVTRVMTDNGACYKSFAFRDFCRERGLKHIRTKPYTPKTNGKAERFIQTSLREWAYAKAYPTSDQRAAELHAWLHRYNWHRPHGGIGSKTPISRLGLHPDNLLSLHS
jgi:transposase InsO family protein